MSVHASQEQPWITSRLGPSGYRTESTVRGHVFVADEPGDVGGTDQGPTPYELLVGALAACTAMTLRMYAARKGWPLGEVVVRLRPARAHAADCADCETQAVGVGRLERELVLGGPLDDTQRARLLQIADRCPVKQTLERGLQIVPAAPQARAGSGAGGSAGGAAGTPQVGQ